MKNKAKTAVSKTMREKTEEALIELENYPSELLRLIR